MFLKWREIEVS